MDLYKRWSGIKLDNIKIDNSKIPIAAYIKQTYGYRKINITNYENVGKEIFEVGMLVILTTKPSLESQRMSIRKFTSKKKYT